MSSIMRRVFAWNVSRAKCKAMASERGYLLLEVAALGVIAVAIAGLLALYARADGLSAQDAARSTAIFLALAELADMEERAYAGKLTIGSGGYSGSAADFEQNGATFQLASETVARGDLVEANVKVSWNIVGNIQRGGSIELARIIR